MKCVPNWWMGLWSQLCPWCICAGLAQFVVSMWPLESMDGSSSVNHSEPNQWCSDTVFLHGGHSSVFLSTCHVVCALCLCGTALCLGFQTLDLTSFCTAGGMPSSFEMTKISLIFNCHLVFFFFVVSHLMRLIKCLHFLKTVSLKKFSVSFLSTLLSY